MCGIINRLKSILPIFLVAVFLAMIILPFYQNGAIISGWEGAYFLDFPLLLKTRGFSWIDEGAGTVSYILSFAYVFHLLLLQMLVHSERIVNFVMIFLLYFLPFVAVYGLAKQVKLRTWLAFLIGLFYITNPFMSNFMKSINQWNMLAAFIFPASFWIILRFYRENLKLFFIFGIFSSFFAFTNINPPTMVLYQIAMVISISFTTFYRERKPNLVTALKKYSLVLLSFLLFNFWWIINWFYVFTSAQSAYTTSQALSWLKGTVNFIPAVWRTLNLASLLENPFNPQYDFLNSHYSYFFSPILMAIPLLILITAFFQKKKLKNYQLLLLGMVFVVIFLAKGIRPPLGKIYELMVIYVPLFNIFKSAAEKWGTLLIFLFTVFVIFYLKTQKKRSFTVIVAMLTVYVTYNLIPFVTGNFLPDYKFNDQVTGSKRFVNKPEYQQFREELNNDPLQYRILSLPGGYNYQVALNIEGNRYYTGNDPVLFNTNKPFFAPHIVPPGGRPFFYENISDPDYLRALSYFNVRKIVINHNEYPWFSFQAKESTPEIEAILNKSLKSVKDGSLTVYDTGNYYLPRFYVPTVVVKTNKPFNNLLDVFKDSKRELRSVFTTQNVAGLTDSLTPPNITIAKINPTKYKIKVEKAKSPYLLVFSTNFHKGWQAYIKPEGENRDDYQNIIGNYFNSQIKESAVGFNFVRQDVLETLGLKPLSEDRHILVNWYANAWYIKPEDAGSKENYEIIVEYWPQRLFYLGAAVSLSTLLGSTIILVLKIKKRK